MLIRAIRDSNMPKFLSEDAILFEAIISDLFPGIDTPTVVSDSLVPQFCSTAFLQTLQTHSAGELSLLVICLVAPIHNTWSLSTVCYVNLATMLAVGRPSAGL